MTFGSHAIPSDDMAGERRLLLDDIDVFDVIASAGIDLIADIGDELKARCPFHPEDTSSFRLDRATGRWRCLGCGRCGDIFDFLGEYLHEPFGSIVSRLTCDSDDQRSDKLKLPALADKSRSLRSGRATSANSQLAGGVNESIDHAALVCD